MGKIETLSTIVYLHAKLQFTTGSRL